MTTIIRAPIVIIPELGEQSLLGDGDIINAGGISGPHFTVGGKPLIFADGTASDGTGQVIVTNNTQTSIVQAYEHVQDIVSTTWVIQHNQASTKVQITIWDSDNEVILAESVKIIDLNQVQVNFNSPASGRAVLMMF